jgi:two-component system sensor histidine kinase QseC
VRGSRAAFGILIRNLVDNAIRYSPQHSSVSVLIQTLPREVMLRIIDSGPGVPLDMRERIFDRFYRQVENKEEGSGLGLSIVSNIVRLHRGTIQALDAPSGKGFEMRVSLPRTLLLNEENAP